MEISRRQAIEEFIESKSIAERLEDNGHIVMHDKKCQFHKKPQCSGYVLIVNGGEAFICSDCGEIELG